MARAAGPTTRAQEAQQSVSEIFEDIFNQLPLDADGPGPTLDTEFVYYTAALRTLAPALTCSAHRRATRRWIRKLYGPEYHCDMFKEKRNRYVLALSLTLLDDEVFGIFAKPPPSGALPDVASWTKPAVLAPAWESDLTWQQTAESMPDHIFSYKCSVHKNGARCPTASATMHELLDDEFRFLLYLVRPYAALLPCSSDKDVAASWLQALCAVKRHACPHMKGIRNDYMKALLGYASELRLAGPFHEYPPNTQLVPLRQAAKVAARKNPITDPTTRDASDFLRDQPLVEDGAFCFVAVTARCEDPERQHRRRRGQDRLCEESRRRSRMRPHAAISGILSLHGLELPDEDEDRHPRTRSSSRLPKGSSARFSVTLSGRSV